MKKSLECAIINISISRLFPTQERSKNNVGEKSVIIKTAFAFGREPGEKTGDMLINIPILLVKCNLSMRGS